MRVLLRQPVTGLFYAGADRWTGNAAEAFNFEATDRAMDQACDSNLQDVEVLVHFENPSFEIPMTIHGFGR